MLSKGFLSATTGGKIEFPSSDAPNVFSPASVASEWEAVVFHNNFHEDRTPYQGPPTDEVDKAWESLYKSECYKLPSRTSITHFVDPRYWGHQDSES